MNDPLAALRKFVEGYPRIYQLGVYNLRVAEAKDLLAEFDCLAAMLHDMRQESDAYQQGYKDGKAVSTKQHLDMLRIKAQHLMEPVKFLTKVMGYSLSEADDIIRAGRQQP
jgi:hypothetical protein